ncbi:MAG TPA: hypothetical protein VKQ08_12250, partial [Cyclobacteriaceae bacterium]|nr:hypothetical protein [Cyclobacteriaceae bacterium]
MKILKRTLFVVLLLIVGYSGQYAWRAFPIISGYGAKDLCSCAFVAGRDPKDVLGNELNSFPLRLGSFRIDNADSSATGTVFGLAKRKAMYRRGLGCSLVV